MKIAIYGKMCSGKTTIANLIKEHDDRYEIFSFGKKIKILANELFGMDLDNKNRTLMIQIGSKMREIDENVWVNYIINETKDKEFCIIDDLRFQNELNLLEENNWNIIQLDINEDLQLIRLKKLYKENYIDHIKNKNHLSEQNNLIFKKSPLIINSSNNLESIKKDIINEYNI
jgi:dephospho-CoA kinase